MVQASDDDGDDDDGGAVVAAADDEEQGADLELMVELAGYAVVEVDVDDSN